MGRPGRGGDRKSGKPHGPNFVRYHKVCDYCNKTFNCARPDAVYCGPRCRSAAARDRARIDRKHQLAQLDVQLAAAVAEFNVPSSAPPRG